jgi:stage V sporulation protein G
MQVTEIRISVQENGRLKAFVSLVLDGVLAVRGVKIIEGNSGRLFLAMPSRRRPDGTYQDVVHPVTPDFRNLLEGIVLGEYTRVLRAGVRASTETEEPPPDRDA